MPFFLAYCLTNIGQDILPLFLAVLLREDLFFSVRRLAAIVVYNIAPHKIMQ